MKKLILATLVLCALSGMPALQGFAAERYVSGHISAVIVSPGGSFAFTLKENVPLCNAAVGESAAYWVTVNHNYVASDAISNLLSAVLSAKLAGHVVEVRGYSAPEPYAEWGCRLEDLGIGD